jgi:hypothetical protein
MIVPGEAMVQITRDVDLPLHYEASPLRAAVGAVGWPAGMVAIAVGIAAFVEAGSVAVEAVSALFVVAGSALVVLLVRCRRYEVTIGKRMIEQRLGPFRRTLPTGCVTDAAERPASSWRRLYAPRELRLDLSVESRPLIVPTHDPDELRSALIGSEREDEKSPTRADGGKSEIQGRVGGNF